MKELKKLYQKKASDLFLEKVEKLKEAVGQYIKTEDFKLEEKNGYVLVHLLHKDETNGIESSYNSIHYAIMLNLCKNEICYCLIDLNDGLIVSELKVPNFLTCSVYSLKKLFSSMERTVEGIKEEGAVYIYNPYSYDPFFFLLEEE